MSTSFPSIGSPTLLTGNADPSGTTMDRGGAPAPDQGGSPLTTDGGSYVEGESTQNPSQGNGGGGGDDTGSTQNAGSGSTTGTGGSNPQNQGMGALNGQTWAQGTNSPGGFPGQGLHRGTNPDNPPPGQSWHRADEGEGGKPGKGGDKDTGGPGKTNPIESQASPVESTGRHPGETGSPTKPLTTIIDQTGRIVSQLGSALLGGDKPATSTILHTPTNTLSRPDPGITSPRPGSAGDSMGRVTGEPTGRGGLTGHTDGPVLARGAAEAPNPQAALNGRNTGAQTPGNATPGSSANTQPPGTQQQTSAQQTSAQQQAAQQAALSKDGIQAAAAQALLGGLAGQTAQSLAAQPQNPAAQLMQGADARAMQGAPFAQATGLQSQAPLQEKPQTLTQQPAQQQNATRGDKELRNPQQLPAETRQRQEPGATDRALTKQAAEQQGRTLVDARNAEAQARAKGLRDGADARRTGLAENTRQTVNENTKRSELAGTERRPASAMASLRHALDWVGQQARGIGADARTDEEGATTMRVVAGLVVAAVFVGVAIAVLYALRVAFVP